MIIKNKNLKSSNSLKGGVMNKIKQEEMVLNTMTVFANIGTAISTILSSVWGYITIIALYIGATFAGISGLIHITLILVVIDLLLGLSVTVIKKGKDKITSNKLRNSLLKTFFYLLFICMIFLIETQLIDGYYVTSKLVFAIISGVELWSIAANALIIMPNFPFLRIFKKYLTAEMSKKLDIKVEDILDEKKD